MAEAKKVAKPKVVTVDEEDGLTGFERIQREAAKAAEKKAAKKAKK